jgi:hypothetical protein
MKFRSRDVIDAFQYTGTDESIVKTLRWLYDNLSITGRLRTWDNDAIEAGSSVIRVNSWVYVNLVGHLEVLDKSLFDTQWEATK